jgi:hypothetical protein
MKLTNEELYQSILKTANIINNQNRKGLANHIIVSGEVAEVIQRYEEEEERRRLLRERLLKIERIKRKL